MQRANTETSAASATSNAHFGAQPGDDERTPHDDTTVSFDGLMKVSQDDRGSDPYNRTGSFKRLVR